MKWPMGLVLILTLLFSVEMNAETIEKQVPYLSVHSGKYLIDSDYFEKIYNTDHVTVLGGGFGIPVSNRFSIIQKVSYYSKEGISLIYSYHWENDEYTGMTVSDGGPATLKQWMFNTGLEYQIYRYKDFISLDIGAGITSIAGSEIFRRDDHEEISSTKGFYSLGYFLSGGAELALKSTPYALRFETLYNHSSKKSNESNLGRYPGLLLNMSARIYFRNW